MARGPRYKVPRRRRREGRTNYYKRYRMVISGQKVRAVIRKTINNVIVQLTEFGPYGDRTLVAATARELRRYGWLGGLRNTPSAYLTGFLAGLKARVRGISYAVPDIGLNASVRGSLIYGAIKGLKDAGIEIPASDEVLPSEDRINGGHIASYAELLLKEDPERYRKQFSRILARNLSPEKLPGHFREVRDRLMKDFKGMIA